MTRSSSRKPFAQRTSLSLSSTARQVRVRGTSRVRGTLVELAGSARASFWTCGRSRPDKISSDPRDPRPHRDHKKRDGPHADICLHTSSVPVVDDNNFYTPRRMSSSVRVLQKVEEMRQIDPCSVMSRVQVYITECLCLFSWALQLPKYALPLVSSSGEVSSNVFPHVHSPQLPTFFATLLQVARFRSC